MMRTIFQRESLIEQLTAAGEWDIIVIGGGASGLGVALDALSRGFKTLLVEGVDFAKGTSSRSTKLVHGGVRYMAQGDIALVQEALHERGLLAQNAPHLVADLSFVIPNYSWWGGPFYTLGMKLYDVLAGRLSLGKSIHIDKGETLRRIPTVKSEKLKGGVLYHDAQFDDARLAVNLAQTCLQLGGIAINYFPVTGLIKDKSGKVKGVRAVDAETQKDCDLYAKVVVNATGVFVDDILRMDRLQAQPMVKPSQGVHLVLDKSFLPGTDAIMIPRTDDGRVLFAVPWHNRVLVGTTDTPLDKYSYEPVALKSEVDFILRTAGQYLTHPPKRSDVRSVFAGLRPLAAPQDGRRKTKEISRSHKVLVSRSNLITLIGGKWTTFRKMGQDVVDRAIRENFLSERKSQSEKQQIWGAMENVDRSDHLYVYGADKRALLGLIERDQRLGEKLHPSLAFTGAEVVWAVRNELARTLEDVLARRVRALFLDARAAVKMAPEVAGIIARELGRDTEWKKSQVADFTALAQNYTLT
ncbi:MAG: glycerol-3-phosphate dehydrogenase/oxidase [Flavobacteriales bacterium]